MKTYSNLFNLITNADNLFSAWDIFKRGKGNKIDVHRFEQNLEQNIFELQRDLASQNYRHGHYDAFKICDPKPRLIHRATVRDRVLHHAVFKVLYCVFDPTFIDTSFSCRWGRGTHRGVEFLSNTLRQVSRNHTRPCFALKCDVKKFFANIDHQIILELLTKKIKDQRVLWLLAEIINSFPSFDYAFTRERERESNKMPRCGVPIGNLTSQIFANIYLNELDQFVKHKLKVKHYARYTDDFIIVSDQKNYLKDLLVPIELFLEQNLKLELHPEKVFIRKFNRGIDFLGYISLPFHRLLRSSTRHRMFRKLNQKFDDYEQGLIAASNFQATLHSYLGVLSHGDCYQLELKLKNNYWLNYPVS